jgi:hypothetical protein
MIHEPEPGSFHGIEEVEGDPYRLPDAPAAPKEPEAYVEDPGSPLGKAAALFVAQFGMPGRVLYPGCGAHAIDRLFPGAEITYVDPSEADIAALRKVLGSRAKALALGIQETDPSPDFDLLFSLNTHAPMYEQLQRVRAGGHVFCNNYFGTQDAERVLTSGTCRLLAVIERDPPAEDGGNPSDPYLLEEDLDDYLALQIDPKGIEVPRKRVAEYYVFVKHAG